MSLELQKVTVDLDLVYTLFPLCMTEFQTFVPSHVAFHYIQQLINKHQAAEYLVINISHLPLWAGNMEPGPVTGNDVSVPAKKDEPNQPLNGLHLYSHIDHSQHFTTHDTFTHITSLHTAKWCGSVSVLPKDTLACGLVQGSHHWPSGQWTTLSSSWATASPRLKPNNLVEKAPQPLTPLDLFTWNLSISSPKSLFARKSSLTGWSHCYFESCWK